MRQSGALSFARPHVVRADNGIDIQRERQHTGELRITRGGRNDVHIRSAAQHAEYGDEGGKWETRIITLIRASSAFHRCASLFVIGRRPHR